ncbi:hypothetical protein [Kitasatospora sp. NPDC002040]|uniref:hypothetical protein n=1 Tax=Kitasatospora sp. NPDC002040 TaxID=3154661 RepID=UPI0033257C4E
MRPHPTSAAHTDRLRTDAANLGTRSTELAELADSLSGTGPSDDHLRARLREQAHRSRRAAEDLEQAAALLGPAPTHHRTGPAMAALLSGALLATAVLITVARRSRPAAR